MIVAAYAIIFFSLGIGVGFALHEEKYHRIYRAQQARGDYWFDRYQQVVRDDWEPIGSDDE